ncbi:MAG: threonine--tRNA ligase [Candidatus Muiribacterium halophilum]|uniref:Threonine--tRNA ligase n=1 Tax=Muiribacterium halophilum TaxID=2053465 RepID=A0A2N5ZE43_MUIH1|nr:MAG: threonine--tRNA ligase [Candidatus Muirbacterium halophilum]
MNIEKARHSLAHVLAEAVQRLFPDAKLGMGPAIENGFYYDFDTEEKISSEDLKKIQKEMKKILKKKNTEFEYIEVSIEEAISMFSEKKEHLKLELIEDLKAQGEEKLGIFKQGNWFDLCRGPHVEKMKDLPFKGFKLDRVAGAYWKSDEKNKMLTRIYGLAFEDADKLNDFIEKREEARKRDHRKLGKELEIFAFSDLVGKGLPLLLPKGATLRRVLERFIVDEELRRGYEHVITPVLGKVDLYKVSGHWDHYKDSMYNPIDIEGEEFVLRPMTCPHHFEIYKNNQHSYNDLPRRFAEISSLFRFEKSGELSGLIRLRNFTLADAHIICTQQQMKKEFKDVLILLKYIMDSLGISEKVWYRASLRDDEKGKYVDNDEMWEQSEKVLLEILDELGWKYEISRGDAAFYGPKLDIQIQNVNGKDDTIITNQIDLFLAERFQLEYIDSDGEKKRPVIIHRSSVGCLERTMAFLIEHYAGALPLWLSPVQIRLLSIADRMNDYVEEVYEKLQSRGIRVEKDIRNEKLGKKIREARLMRIPYLAIVGQTEMDNKTLTIRNRNTGEQKEYSLDEFIDRIILEENKKSLELEL